MVRWELYAPFKPPGQAASKGMRARLRPVRRIFSLSAWSCFMIMALLASLMILPPNAGTIAASGTAPPAVPVVTKVSPSTGPATGGTTVTITGTGFPTGTTVTVDFGSSNPATNVKVKSGTRITCTSPGDTGTETVDVTVTTAGGTSATSSADQFSYVPVVNGVSPSSGPTAGGTVVTITGMGFSAANAVSFGAITIYPPSFTVNDTQIMASSPPESAGKVHVTVTVITAAGTSITSDKTASDYFTYMLAPEISTISPSSGPASGGTTVTITGSNFTGATAVNFDATAVNNFTVNSPGTKITVASPKGSAGTVDVTVTTPGGTSNFVQFTYYSAPTVSSISPSGGPTTGGASVTIYGSNFTGATAVNFDATAVKKFTVNSQGTQITVASPKGSAGVVSVTVTTPGGTSNSVQFTYYSAPTVSSISPSSGPTTGGTSVTIYGTNFIWATGVSFDGTAASFQNNSDGMITAVSPARSAGKVHVTVTSPAGTSAKTSADYFTYIAPTIKVYSDPGYSVPWTSSSTSNTAYIECSGLTSAALYTLLYYDNNGNLLTDEGFEATSDIYQAVFPLAGYTHEQAGLWKVVLLNNGAPVAHASFWVNSSDIPEFPTWFAGILVMGMCTSCYIWLRKRYVGRLA